jgi:hypothetical protein
MLAIREPRTHRVSLYHLCMFHMYLAPKSNIILGAVWATIHIHWINGGWEWGIRWRHDRTEQVWFGWLGLLLLFCSLPPTHRLSRVMHNTVAAYLHLCRISKLLICEQKIVIKLWWSYYVHVYLAYGINIKLNKPNVNWKNTNIFLVDYLYSNVPPTFGIVENRNRTVSSPYQYFEIFRHNIKGEGHKKKFKCTGKNK